MPRIISLHRAPPPVATACILRLLQKAGEIVTVPHYNVGSTASNFLPRLGRETAFQFARSYAQWHCHSKTAMIRKLQCRSCTKVVAPPVLNKYAVSQQLVVLEGLFPMIACYLLTSATLIAIALGKCSFTQVTCGLLVSHDYSTDFQRIMIMESIIQLHLEEYTREPFRNEQRIMKNYKRYLNANDGDYLIT